MNSVHGSNRSIVYKKQIVAECIVRQALGFYFLSSILLLLPKL